MQLPPHSSRYRLNSLSLSLSLPPVACEPPFLIRGSLPIPVTYAFVKFFLNGMDRGLGDENGKRRLLALQPAIEKKGVASLSNLDFYSVLLACQAPQVSLSMSASQKLFNILRRWDAIFFRCSTSSLWPQNFA